MCPANRMRHDRPVHRVAPRPGDFELARARPRAAPRAAIINNGTRKGGQPDAMRVLFSSPGLEDLWQMHFSQLSGQEYTVPGAFIANELDQPPTRMPIAADGCRRRRVSSRRRRRPTTASRAISRSSRDTDGTFTVTNTRNNFSKTYRPVDRNATN